jgi:hypothetical protein
MCSTHFDRVNTVNIAYDGARPVLNQFNERRKHVKKCFEFTVADGLDNVLHILREEEETSTLATCLMLLTLVRFENLILVVDWVKRLFNVCVLNSVGLSDVMEHLWSIRFNFNVSFILFKVL